jgi:hypothetical protein
MTVVAGAEELEEVVEGSVAERGCFLFVFVCWG